MKIAPLLVSSLTALSLFNLTSVNAASPGPAFYEKAKVLEVVPQYREQRISTPVRHCEQVPVTVREHHRPQKSAGGMLVGGLLGAAIGHQIGGGNGQKAATALGTIIGAEVGHNAVNSGSGHYNEYTSLQEQCEYTDRVTYESYLDGYEVTYRYRGKQYTTLMDEDPGDRIRLKVQLTPVGL